MSIADKQVIGGRLMAALSLALIAGCGDSAPDASAAASAPETAVEAPIPDASPSSSDLLQAALDGQTEEMKARYAARNPGATLEFLGIEPGMTVVEALPGGGWYSKILIPYLGDSGTLIGVDYALDMWPKFGFFSDEQIEEKKTWTTSWVETANGWGDGANVEAFVFGDMGDVEKESADAVLMIRALHNLSRFEDDGGYRTQALQDAYNVLKPGGTLGIVQHRAPSDAPDEWATGAAGYLKQAAVVAAVEAAGFELVETSEINANPADQPTVEDFVWRLPPSLATSREDDALRAEMIAIGESDRMTLKFRKSGPASGD
ncbi:MAG: methyltransferase domain-containing protein [Pseudomonadota bacterium]